ncbi:PLP-dependent transferase [Sparassis latifolia]
MSYEKREKAIDLSHHLSDLSRARRPSPLKSLSKFFGRPGVISLAGGLPNEACFPFASISADALIPESFSLKNAPQESSLSWIWKLFGRGTPKERTTPISIPKYPDSPDDVNLAIALQYGTATGLPQLQRFIKEFVEKVYQPAYSDYTIMAHVGNTDGWSRVLQTLCNPGEGFLTEEWTYPSAVAGARPFALQPVPVAMDKEGMTSTDLRKVLSEWDESARGFKRPHVMYTVPIGQNPCGFTMGAQRKKEIYDICVEYDIIICEDDPYYFLQFGEYVQKSQRRSHSDNAIDAAQFLKTLAPTYLKFDYQGRVIRLDTFSKYIAPGSRLGWHTCSPLFAERLERQGETSTQAPCGFGQSLITQLLLNWKYDGYIRWLQGLAIQYTRRRDFFVDCFANEFDLKRSTSDFSLWQGWDVYDGYTKPRNQFMSEKKSSVKVLSFVPPTSGMFLWVKIYFENHPSFKDEDEQSLELQLCNKLGEAGLIICPGSFFAANDTEFKPGTGHFRMSFSYEDLETLKKAVKIFRETTEKFLEL